MPRTVSISEAAHAVMAVCFRQKLPARMIAAKVLAVTGEKVAPRTIARRASEWGLESRRRQAARDQVSDLVEAMKANDFTATEMINALATQALIDSPTGFTNADPLAVQAANLRSEELRLKSETLRVKERAVAVAEQKMKILQAREQRTLEATAELAAKAERGEKISPEDLQRIRDIYGLEAAQA